MSSLQNRIRGRSGPQPREKTGIKDQKLIKTKKVDGVTCVSEQYHMNSNKGCTSETTNDEVSRFLAKNP